VITVGGLLVGAVNNHFALLFVLVRGVRDVAVALAVVLEEVRFPAVSPVRRSGRLLLFATLENFAIGSDGVVALKAFWSYSAEEVWGDGQESFESAGKQVTETGQG